MSKRIEVILLILGFIIASVVLLFGDNLYQQITGHSFFSPTSATEESPSHEPTLVTDSAVYDNFDNLEFDGKWRNDLWEPWNTDLWKLGTHSGCDAVQEKGFLALSCTEPDSQHTLNARRSNLNFNDFDFIEAKIMLDSRLETENGNVAIGFYASVGEFWVMDCGISGNSQDSMGNVFCYISPPLEFISGPSVEYDAWHTIRIQVNPNSTEIKAFIDGQQFASYDPGNANELRQKIFNLHLSLSQQQGTLTIGYIDDVRIGKQE